jgi:hypothetical protein
LILLLVIGTAPPGCKDRNDRSEAAPRSATLIASGDTAGWIMPCGCTANQSGGLLRRGTYLDQLRKGGEVVYVDVGGAASGTSAYHKVKFEAILAGEKLMQVAAHNLGRSELAMGAAYLREVSSRSGVGLISSNAMDAQSGKPIVETHRIVDLSGRKVALIGVVSPKFAAEGVRIADPHQSVLATIAPIKNQYQSLVVLAYLPDDELEQLAAALPEADVVLGGPTGQAMTPRKLGPTLLAAATNKGKFLVELQSDPANGWGGKIAEMGPQLADQPQQQANLNAYLLELGKRNFSAAESGFAFALPPNVPAGYRIAGSESCISCHKLDHESWTHSKHAHAWQVLQEKKFHVDPYCMQCHTTGFGLPGGFDTRDSTPQLVGVGCESCHGPSQAHVQKPTARTTFAATDQCIRCHDHENSPTFAYNSYWPKIVHGKNKTASAARVEQ